MNNDLISREALKDEIKREKELNPCYALFYDKVIAIIDNAPTIIWCSETPEGLPLMDLRERPQGKWICDSDNLPVCKECGEIALQRVFVKMPHLIQEVRMVKSNFCPNCGADMRGSAE